MNEAVKEAIRTGKTALGIEFGSTRIKAVLVDESHAPIAMGTYDWENRLENNIWTYSLEDIWKGLQGCYKSLTDDVEAKYGEKLTTLGSLGFSGMMHGYMPFNAAGELLVPFRTWRNTQTSEACKKLIPVFNFNIPQRWSIAHLYQAILSGEDHVKDIAFFTTLAGYIHWKLSGEKVLGIGEAAGMFPIDSTIMDFDQKMLDQFDGLHNFDWKIRDILPKVLVAGEPAGVLTAEGAKLLDSTGTLQPGVPMCPPEGDAGTGMVATNSVAVRTGNVSAGTSIFAMVVLEKAMEKVHEEIDMVTTPDGMPVAMVHCNNCTSDLNAWVNLLGECAESFGVKVDKNELYGVLYRKALEGAADCIQLFLRRAHHRTGCRASHGGKNSRCGFLTGKLHAFPSVQRSCYPEDWHGHSVKRRACGRGFPDGPWWLLQDSRGGTACHGSRHERTDHRYGYSQ